MTPKPKKQSFRVPLLSAFLCLPLIGFFLFCIFWNRSFFIYLILGFLAIIAYLLSVRRKLILKEAEIQLRIQDIREGINLVQERIKQDERSIASFQEKILSFLQLKGLTEKLGLCLSLEDTSRTLSAEVNRLFNGQEITIILYLFHSKTGDLGISSSRKGQMRVNIKSKKGDAFDQWVIKTMQPLLVEDAKNDYRFDIEKIMTEDSRKVRSLISVLLISGPKTLGLLRIDSPQERVFGTADLRFLSTIADLGAIAIENAQLYERVEQLAIKDGLTNLCLRRHLMDRMTEEVSRHLRLKSPLAFLMIDLDDFKQYNDKFGHVAGDIVLKSVGLLLSEMFREPGTIVCRYGGEEFSVLLPNCSKEMAIKIAQNIRKKIAAQTVFLRREKTHITVSIGGAVFPHDAKMKEELIFKADQALYKAKEEGKNRVYFSSAGES